VLADPPKAAEPKAPEPPKVNVAGTKDTSVSEMVQLINERLNAQ